MQDDRVHFNAGAVELTLHSIGDGVISTDVRGRIDYANPAALAIVGCAPDALIAKVLDDTLRLVSARSRERIDNPLRQAMAQKQVIAPADLLLVRADGTEIAIDTTAAPIRNAQGDVVGGVLVFSRSG